MIRKAADCEKAYKENMRGGNGTVILTHLATPAELNDKGRLFANITLNPGCGIGFHMHEGESELFYVIKGQALYDDNGTTYTVSAGDVMICPPGTGHGVSNIGEEVVEICAVIVYA